MITPPDELYSTTDAAALLGVDPRSVQRWLKDGELAGVRLGGAWRITALALWRRTGIDADMLTIWRDYCREEAAAQRRAASDADAVPPVQSASVPGDNAAPVERICAVASAETKTDKKTKP